MPYNKLAIGFVLYCTKNMNDKKIKVLYILTNSGIGGAQKYVKDLADNLAGDKFEARVFYGGLDIKWLSNKTHPWFLFVNDWLAVIELVWIFKKENPDIIHLNSSKAGVIGSISAYLYKLITNRYQLSTIFTVHGWVFNPSNDISRLIKQFYVYLHKISAYFQDKLICVSQFDYDLAIAYDICPKEKLFMIHNGIDIKGVKFLSKKEARNILKLKIVNSKFDNHWPWIGSVGRLVKEKNYETFIEAAKAVPKSYFFIIGDGPELNVLKLKIVNYKLTDRFFIIPSSGYDAQYLKAFDVFVMSSIKEGLPYVLLETMSAGVPVVVTNAGGMSEMIHNHKNGLMVSQRNPEALARSIGGLLENKTIAEELAIVAKKTVEERFSLKSMIKETERIYI